jgi:hypothetical protein
LKLLVAAPQDDAKAVFSAFARAVNARGAARCRSF